MITFTPQQMSDLQSKINNNDISGFYTSLESYGDDFGRLGKAVTNNNTWQGELANNFAAQASATGNVILTYGSPNWIDINKDIAGKYLGAIVDNNNQPPSYQVIEQIHDDAYAAKGVSEKAWLPKYMLEQSSDPAATWSDWQKNENAADILEDGLEIAGENLKGFVRGAFADEVNTDAASYSANLLLALGGLVKSTALELVADATSDIVSGLAQLAASQVMNSLPFTFETVVVEGNIPWDSNSDGRPDAPTTKPTTYIPPVSSGPSKQASPLVLDLDGDGVELYAQGDYGTYFDLLNSGQAVSTGWVDPDDGLLAFDVNQDGTINDITELFGNVDTDGFTMLAIHDSNSDGVIDSNDIEFENLLIWQDANSDGISQQDELSTLTELGITEINLGAIRLPNIDNDGNTITHESSFTINGVSQDIVDVWFSYGSRVTRNSDDVDFCRELTRYFHRELTHLLCMVRQLRRGQDFGFLPLY